MKTGEIREMTEKEIVERIETESSQLLKLRLNHAVSPLDNNMKIKETRKNIARLKTNLGERTLNEKKKS
jgi:large subunit ribosomal protein L29